jgi:hypothetical protein
VTHQDAVALIRDGVPYPGGSWADLGAGAGVFTRAVGLVDVHEVGRMRSRYGRREIYAAAARKR